MRNEAAFELSTRVLFEQEVSASTHWAAVDTPMLWRAHPYDQVVPFPPRDWQSRMDLSAQVEYAVTDCAPFVVCV